MVITEEVEVRGLEEEMLIRTLFLYLIAFAKHDLITTRGRRGRRSEIDIHCLSEWVVNVRAGFISS